MPQRAADDCLLSLRALASRLQRGSEELSGGATEVAKSLQMSVSELAARNGFEPLTTAVHQTRRLAPPRPSRQSIG